MIDRKQAVDEGRGEPDERFVIRTVQPRRAFTTFGFFAGEVIEALSMGVAGVTCCPFERKVSRTDAEIERKVMLRGNLNQVTVRQQAWSMEK